MMETTDESDDNTVRRKQSDGEGEGEQAGQGVAKMLTTRKAEQVKGEHRHLIGSELVEAFVEFFGEVSRASANLVTTFVERSKQTVNNLNPHALINNTMEGAKQMLRELARTRERNRGAARDSRGFQQRKPATKGMTITPGPAGPTQ